MQTPTESNPNIANAIPAIITTTDAIDTQNGTSGSLIVFPFPDWFDFPAPHTHPPTFFRFVFVGVSVHLAFTHHPHPRAPTHAEGQS